MSNQNLATLVDLFKALGHPVRLRILTMLADGEHCVCQLTAALGLPSSTVSEHLTELRRVGLLGERKVGRWVHCRLDPKETWVPLVERLRPLLMAAENAPGDLTNSREVRRTPMEITCGRAPRS